MAPVQREGIKVRESSPPPPIPIALNSSVLYEIHANYMDGERLSFAKDDIGVLEPGVLVLNTNEMVESSD